MSQTAADRNLLFGILALQMDFITRDELIAAMNAWVVAKDKPLGQILDERGALSAARRAMLEPLVDEHVRVHDGDPTRSLAAIGDSSGIVSDLRRTVADAEVHASLGHVDAAGPTGPDAPTGTIPRDPTPRRVGRLVCGNSALPQGARSRARWTWRRLRGARPRAQPRGGDQGDPGAPRRRRGQPRPVPPRGRDHRRARAPGHRAGLRPGPVLRRAALLCDALHQG